MHDRPINVAIIFLFSMLFLSASSAQNDIPSVQASSDGDQAALETATIHNRVKYFDFDERKLGYYEDVPMHWEQLRGPGLPAMYAKGQFDMEVGHDAPPSFRLDIASGNVAYEYGHLDLMLVPGSDYTIRGYIRAENLTHAGAMVAAYLVDRFGEQIPGSQRISRVVRAAGAKPEPWQLAELDVSSQSPQAYAMRLQFWIIQDYVWREPDPDEVDPISRRDIYASAWFDDFSVHRLPRVAMTLAAPAGVVAPDQAPELLLEANNATSEPMRLDLSIHDEGGQETYRHRLEVAPQTAAQALERDIVVLEPDSSSPRLAAQGETAASSPILHVTLPVLPPGNYSADLTVLSGGAPLLKRRAHFAVLPRLPINTERYFEFGVDIGPWRQSNVDDLRNALLSLGCGAVKIGIPMNGDIDGAEESGYYRQLSTLLRTLAEKRIDGIGVMLPPTTVELDQRQQTVLDLVTRGKGWQELCGPIFEHFGVLLPAWQTGAEAAELNTIAGWRTEEIEQVREHLRRFISIPKIVVPQAVTAISDCDGDVTSVWIPPDFPTFAFPRALEFLLDNPGSASYWLQLGIDKSDVLTAERRLADTARRVVLCKTLSPGRIFLPAPLVLSDEGGTVSWQPSREFIAYRTMFHFLAGKTAVAAMRPTPDAILIIFRGPDSSCLVAWSWKEEAGPLSVPLYLGAQPRATTLGGETFNLRIEDGRASIPLSPTPIFVDSLDLPLTLFQAGYRLEPKQIQLHEPESRPVINFRNTFEAQLSGSIHLTPPPGWRVEPALVDFVLAPGEDFSQALSFTIPPRQVARPHALLVQFELQNPVHETLEFAEALKLGLRDIDLQASLYWEGNDLIVRLTLRNLSERAVSFNSYCEPIGCARQERFFSEVGAGGVALQTYIFPKSRNLVGTLLPFGIDEIGGTRNLIQFAEVPQ